MISARSISARYASRLAAAKTQSPKHVWDARRLPAGWKVDEFLAPDLGYFGVWFWRAVDERTGAVDHRPYTRKTDAVQRAWFLAATAENALRRSAA